MRKLINLFLFIVLSILLSGFYGVIHNQITYSISSEYFRLFLFVQHQLPEYFTQPARLGVSIIGWSSTWWMGLINGITLGTLWIWNDSLTTKDRFKALGTVCITAFTFSIITYFIAYIQWQPKRNYEVFSFPSYGEIIDDSLQAMTNPYAFLRAETIHNSSYLGGIIGLLIGVFQLWKKKITNS
ncbi:hypothetical protein CLV90_0676 [Maribacter spongiicola]|uniref:Uncharacterized protein n=1 Tax=Maribacter spongiicola TaxID=1206753 RepID=A0A4R7K6W1_9FLAO|nr:hypothetical protein [Maribacter spongiicola]TDT46621.1 hypothetical protein CLV90_0676 [Maribacter spongiicola]